MNIIAMLIHVHVYMQIVSDAHQEPNYEEILDLPQKVVRDASQDPKYEEVLHDNAMHGSSYHTSGTRV